MRTRLKLPNRSSGPPCGSLASRAAGILAALTTLVALT